jgi:hypothetical protein
VTPRELTFIVVKRIDPRLRSLYGHWWIEVDRRESYGWWPDRRLRAWHWFTGTGGVLYGIGLVRRARPDRDGYHRAPADHRFHPLLALDKTDEQVRAEIRAFAQAYRGGWRWAWPWSLATGGRPEHSCRSFQDELFHTVGLIEPQGLLHTRGAGCPFLFPARSLCWRSLDRLLSAIGKDRPVTPSPTVRSSGPLTSSERENDREPEPV